MLRIILLIFVTTVGAQFACGQTAKPRTVRDYYLLLPDKYFEANQEQRIKWMLDPKRGAIVDVRNGYLLAPGDGAQMSIVVCLFKRPDGTYLVGAAASYFEDIEYTRLSFYRYKNGNLIDVTKLVVPITLREELRYDLPRYGTTIKVNDQKRRRLYDLVWNGRRFWIKRFRNGNTQQLVR